MNESITLTDFDKQIIEGMRHNNKLCLTLPERDELLLCLHRLINNMMTGRIDIDFCNSFIREAIQLLINSIFLYEDGNFDCAFFSIRQASEAANNMLYLSSAEKAEFKTWKSKGHFPMNSLLMKRLKEINCNYTEVNNVLSVFFEEHNELIKSAHKIIHKQGFDTFYAFRVYEHSDKFDIKAEMQFFLRLLKSCIAKIIILFIVIEPLSLILADEDLSSRFNFNPITEAIDLEFIKRYLSEDIIEKIKGTEFFKDFSRQFSHKEKMTVATFDVVRNEFFNIDTLEEIEKQKHLLCLGEQVILEILQKGIEISRFYPDCITICGYFTSISSNNPSLSWDKDEYEQYINSDDIFNQPYKNVFRSVMKVINCNWILEHNEPIANSQIDVIKSIVNKFTQSYELTLKEFEQQLKNFDSECY